MRGTSTVALQKQKLRTKRGTITPIRTLPIGACLLRHNPSSVSEQVVGAVPCVHHACNSDICFSCFIRRYEQILAIQTLPDG